jgi:hypothetical protein
MILGISKRLEKQKKVGWMDTVDTRDGHRWT